MGGFCGSHAALPEQKAQIIKQITLNDVLLSLVHGNIIYEDVEAVILSLDSNLLPLGPISSSMLKAGGSKLDESIRLKWTDISPPKPGDVLVTNAGSLHAFYTLNVVCPDPMGPEEVLAALEKLLETVGKEGYESISLSLLEVPDSQISKAKQTEVYFQVIADYLRNQRLPKLQRLRLIHSDLLIVQAFESEFARHFPKWIQSRHVVLRPQT